MRPVALGLASGTVLWFLAFLCAGGGHGTYLPLAVFGAPLSLLPGVWLVSPLIMWPLSGVAVARRWRLALVVLILCHLSGVVAGVVLGTPVESVDEQWGYLAKAARQIGLIIVTAFIVYAAALSAMIYLALRVSRPAASTTG